jgi:hypothetical protein
MRLDAFRRTGGLGLRVTITDRNLLGGVTAKKMAKNSGEHMNPAGNFRFPNDENGSVLRDMVRSGDDLTMPRNVDFSVVFREHGSAKEFVRDVRARGYVAEVESGDEFWDVTVVVNMIPDHKRISSIESELESLAAPLGGWNDGWGCFVVKR